MTHKEYNGWTNYETWLVKLWMDNDQGSYNYFQEMARENDNARDLADAIKEAHEAMLPDLEGFPADLMNAAMSEVNWREIAESILGDLEPQEEEAEEA